MVCCTHTNSVNGSLESITRRQRTAPPIIKDKESGQYTSQRKSCFFNNGRLNDMFFIISNIAVLPLPVKRHSSAIWWFQLLASPLYLGVGWRWRGRTILMRSPPETRVVTVLILILNPKIKYNLPTGRIHLPCSHPR